MTQQYGSVDGTKSPGDKDPLLSSEHRKSENNKRLSDVAKEFNRRHMQENQAQQQGGAQPVMKNLFSKVSKEKKNGEANHSKQEQGKRQSEASEQRRKSHHKRRYSWLYILLHPHSRHPHSVLYKSFICTVILIDVLFFIASTEPWADNGNYAEVFYVEEGVASTIFLIEYICRVYVAPQSRRYQNMTPLQARWHYAFTITALIDLLSAVPFFLEIPSGWNLPNLTWIRVFRLFRILKTKSYARSMETVWRVVYYNGEILYVALNLCVLIILVTAVLMYYLRPQDPDDAEDFQSLSATMYLSAMMLTGQGQPDGPLPWYTKFVVLLTGFFSVAMFAVPASMLVWGFEAEAERCAKRARQKYIQRTQEEGNDTEEGREINDGYRPYADYLSSSSEPSEGDTTDEEYLDIIAGGGDEEEKGKGKDTAQDDVVKQLIRTFQTSDTDASGTLSMDEFIQLMTDPSETSQQMTMVGMATSVGMMAERVQRMEHEMKETQSKLEEILKAVASKKK